MPFVNRIYFTTTTALGHDEPQFYNTLNTTGPIVDVIVSVHEAYIPAMQKLGQPIPPPQAIRALIDTGASRTCLDKETAAALTLKSTGAAKMHTPQGEAEDWSPTYAITFEIQGSTFRRSINNAVEADLQSQGLEMLIGRDILEDCHFVYNGTLGLITLSYP